MENKENRGAIFKNNNKTEDRQPDYKGGINVDGVEKEIALWLSTSKDGKTNYFSVAVSDPFVKDEKKEESVSKEEESDSLPF